MNCRTRLSVLNRNEMLIPTKRSTNHVFLVHLRLTFSMLLHFRFDSACRGCCLSSQRVFIESTCFSWRIIPPGQLHLPLPVAEHFRHVGDTSPWVCLVHPWKRRVCKHQVLCMSPCVAVRTGGGQRENKVSTFGVWRSRRKRFIQWSPNQFTKQEIHVRSGSSDPGMLHSMVCLKSGPVHHVMAVFFGYNGQFKCTMSLCRTEY